MISVSEFIKDKNNVKKLAKRAEIIASKDARKETQESKKQARESAGSEIGNPDESEPGTSISTAQPSN